MSNTKNPKQIYLQTTTNTNESKTQTDDQVYLSIGNQSNEQKSLISKQPYLNRTSGHLTTVDSDIAVSSNDQETVSTPFGIKHFWY
jgi:hypothetical protein